MMCLEEIYKIENIFNHVVKCTFKSLSTNISPADNSLNLDRLSHLVASSDTVRCLKDLEYGNKDIVRYLSLVMDESIGLQSYISNNMLK